MLVGLQLLFFYFFIFGLELLVAIFSCCISLMCWNLLVILSELLLVIEAVLFVCLVLFL